MPAVSRATRLGAVASVLLVALLAVSGCGVLDSNTASPGPSATTSTGPTADPTALPQTCQLLTADEVKSLTGLTVEDQAPSDEDGKRGYEWTLGLKHLVVELGVTSESLFKDEADGYDVVEGVGDQAYVQRALLFARKGTTSIYVDAPGEDDAAQTETAKKVALKVIEKLGS
ncbi:DUF3558 domain-containing protein [Tenggerimyces flavus]|uniref:DUF3558 domain-containing protein n=1 Tax=Tenggerimyces flavus TaxID=1708749 RepID=A0ABV7Y4U3_9ACTN|nr:hypothetical protein [Tenggerimyces flavus]MBM7788323.1 hypothetical protein [Tenggerimyces flavus]